MLAAVTLVLGPFAARSAGGGGQVSPETTVPCAACQALSLAADQMALSIGALNGARLVIRVTPGETYASSASAMEDIRARGGRPGLHFVGIPPADDPLLGAPADLMVIETGSGDPERLMFDLKRALAAARGRNAHATLFLAAPSSVSTELQQRGLGPYIDGFVLPPGTISRPADLLTPVAESIRLVRLTGDPAAAREILRASAALQSWFPEGLIRAADRTLSCGTERLAAYLNPTTLDLIGVSAACASPATVTSDLRGAVVDRLDLDGVSAFRVRGDAGGAFASQVEVAGARTLTVAEIVARHQAAAARQASEIRTEIAEGTLTLTFEAPGFVAPIAITSKTTIFGTGEPGSGTEIRQADIRVNGVPFSAGRGAPRLPIIEPERAAAPPLAITLTGVYRYALAGRATVDGRAAYIVSFAPLDGRASLYRGRAWIDAATFGMVRVAAVQTGLRGPITASEQTDEFHADGRGHWLLARSDVRQTYEGASVRTPIHRLLVIDRHEINPPDFAARRAEAYASQDVMLRDTPQGYRYLKDGRRKAEDGRPKDAGAPPPERVLAGRVDRIRTLAFGVIVDPNISRPLPFAGLSYVDFNLFGTGTQFNGFFGGSFGQLAFSAPSLKGSRWQLAGRAFGIASSYNDRAFDEGREQYALDIRQRPADAAVWLLRPLSPRAALRIEYDWDYTRFTAGELTAAAFAVPRNQNAHALRIGIDLQRAGWQASLWGSAARRVGWRPWGLPGDASAVDPHGSYQRFGASLLRSQALSPRVSTRIELAVMDGRHLDRFSRYAFGTFENRLHGYPSALIRYDRGGALRSAIAWTAAKGIRLDGFADTAEVHDPGFGPRIRNYTGVGAAGEVPAPFGTLLALEWGFGLRGINTDGRAGTHVIRISGYKIF